MQALLDTLVICELAFQELENEIPRPVRVPSGDHFVFRYAEQTPQILVVQKLARLCTGLRSVFALLARGLYQEVGVMFRLLDEFREDASFMCEAIRTGQLTDLQQRFINEFFQEEFDSQNPLDANQPRDRVSRRRIQAALARVPHAALNPHDGQALPRTITKSFSGYVHGASGHILELYGGDPSRYYLEGMLGTPRQQEFEDQTWDYFYRSLLSFAEAALAFGLADLAERLRRCRDYFEHQWGQTEWRSPEDLIREMRRNARR